MTQYIIKNNQFVAGYVLWQFANSEEIPADDRKKILTICENSIDIEKGEKWHLRLMNELADTNFGVVCLTK